MAPRSSAPKRGRRMKLMRNPHNRRRASPAQVIGRTIAVVLGCVAIWMAFHAPQLRVKRIEVLGADRLSDTRVRQLAGVPLGGNIFRVNLYRARVAVQKDPMVKSASVTRALPNGIRILVRERHPVFVVSYAGRYFEADSTGMLFRQVPRPSPNLPRLSLRNVGRAQRGGTLPLHIIKPALACLRLTARDRMLLREISIDGPHELWLNMIVPMRSSGRQVAGLTGKELRVRLGRPEELSLKLEDARKILTSRPQVLKDALYLDVSCAGRPVYMAQTPAGPGSTTARGTPGLPGPAVPIIR